MKKAFVLVGHSSFGKSETLKRVRIDIPMRTRSNDDIKEETFEFFQSFIKKDNQNIIFPLCPDFREKKKRTVKILDFAKKSKYELFFFILKYKPIPNRFVLNEICHEEILKLVEYGKIEVCCKTGKEERADDFKKFIIDNLGDG